MEGTEKKTHHVGSTSFATAAVAALLVALLLGIGGTFAALTDAYNHSGNQGYADAKLVQTWGDQVVTSIYPGYTQERTAIAENKGTEAIYVRIKLDKFWADRSSRTDEEDGTDKTNSNDATGDSGKLTPTSDPQFNADYIEVGWADTEKWVDGEDGWWYYTDVIEPGQSSTSLISSVGISTQLGEENNDNKSTETAHKNMPSAYLTEAAVLDVELQAVTTYPENANNKGDTGSKTNKASYAKSAFIAKTGDGLSPLVITLFALALVALAVCVIFFIASRKRSKQEDEETTQEVTHFRV